MNALTGRAATRRRPLLLVVALLMTVGAAPAAVAAAATPATAPVDRYGACLNAQREGDLLLVMDESGSLQTTDPAAARVDAAGYLLRRLSAYVESTGSDLHVAVAGFGRHFSTSQSWTPLTPQTLPSITADVETYRTRHDALDTDYWIALEGTRRLLSERPSAGSAGHCQAVAWFSDGQLDLVLRDHADDRARFAAEKPYAEGIDLSEAGAAERAEQAAAEAVCRPGGVADQLRSSGVVMFGVGLQGTDAGAGDFDLMQSITTGSAAGGTACGALTEPAPGQFQLARDIDDLLLAFDAISTPGQAPVQNEAGVCQGAACSETHRFVLDTSINAVHVLGSADVPGVEAVLTLPSGAQVPLTRDGGRPRTVPFAGGDIQLSWPSPTSLLLDLSRQRDDGGSSEWSGVWSVTFVDPTASSPGATSRSNIHITGDLLPAWPDAADTALVAGETVEDITFGLVDDRGRPVRATSVQGTAVLSAELLDTNGRSKPVASRLAKDELDRPLDLDLSDLPPGPSTLRLTLDVTTADAVAPDGTPAPGTPLAPRVVDLPVVVQPPVGFPRVPALVDFGSIEGPVDEQVVLPVTGAGCVWFMADRSPVVAAGPEDVGVSLTSSAPGSAAQCQQVGADGWDLPLRLVTEQPGNGTLRGTIMLGVAADGAPDRVLEVPVTFVADLRKEPDTTRGLLAFALSTLLGVAIPLGLAALVKRATAKIPDRALYARRLPVTVRSGDVLREGEPFELRPSDLVTLVPIRRGGARRLDADGVELRTRTGLSPLGAGHVRVHAPGLLTASAAGSRSRHGGIPAVLPLAVHGSWVLLHNPAGPADAAELLLLVGADAPLEQRRDLVEDARRKVPGLLSDLRAGQARGTAADVVPADSAGWSPFDDGPLAGMTADRPAGFGSPATGAPGRAGAGETAGDHDEHLWRNP